MTDTERLIEEAERLSECASPGPWRRGSVHAAEEVWAAYPESIAGLAGERLLLRLNPNFTREHDTAFIARARTLVPELAAALRETAARADKQKQQFDEALGDLMDGHAEEIRKRGLSNAVTAETYDACHAALRQTEEERDRERQRADDLAAANVAANKRIVELEHERDAARAELARPLVCPDCTAKLRRLDRMDSAGHAAYELNKARKDAAGQNKRAQKAEQEAKALRAELARFTTPRPIAEAPRDGTWIGAIWGDMTPEQRVQFGPIVVVQWSGTRWEDTDGNGYEPPTHYIPLPEVKP